MATVTSNRDQVFREMRALGRDLEFTGPGRRRQTFGAELLDLFAASIRFQAVVAQRQPDGSNLAPLRPSTLRRKARKGFSSLILVETGQMMSVAMLRGKRTITNRVCEMEYGGDALAEKKAEWAAEGSRKRRRPKRKFYELNAQAVRDGDALVDDTFDRTAMNHGCE